MPTSDVEPLFRTSDFRVVIGKRELGVTQVTRLSSEARSPDGHGAGSERHDTFATVVLRRALSRSTELYDWRRSVAAGKDDRRDVTIELLDAPGGHAIASWRLVGAWPVRWSGPALDALASEVACEELELAFDDLDWLAADPPKPPPVR